MWVWAATKSSLPPPEASGGVLPPKGDKTFGKNVKIYYNRKGLGRYPETIPKPRDRMTNEKRYI